MAYPAKLLFLAEQATHLAVDDVEAGGRLALDLDRCAQHRPGARQHEALAGLAGQGLLRGHRHTGPHRPADEGAAQVVHCVAASCARLAVDQLDHVAALSPQQGDGRLPDRFPHGLGRGCGRHLAADL